MGVLDAQIGRTGAYVAGDEYSIADVALYPWMLVMRNFYDGDAKLGMDKLEHLVAWMQRIDQRPAVQRGLLVLSNDDKHYTTDGTRD